MVCTFASFADFTSLQRDVPPRMNLFFKPGDDDDDGDFEWHNGSPGTDHQMCAPSNVTC